MRYMSMRYMSMRYTLSVAGALLAVSGGNSAFAFYCEGGQQPVPPAVAAQMALPLCGFAATKRWGPNGCQLCDSRNMYPNPYADPLRHRYPR
jgi:hypothetical protein